LAVRQAFAAAALTVLALSTAAGATGAAPPALAQQPAAAIASSGATVLTADRQALATLQNQLPSTTDDDRLAAMGQQAAAIQASADGVIASLNAQVARLDADLRALPVDRRHRLLPSAVQLRNKLLAERAGLTRQIALVQPVAALAGTTFSMIAERRRESFSARVLAQTPSPLTPAFWTSIAGAAGGDLARLKALATVAVEGAWAAEEPKGLGGLIVGVIAAVVIIVPIRLWLARLGAAGSGATTGAARRTVLAIWRAAIDVGCVAAAAEAIALGAEWGGLLAPSLHRPSAALVGAVVWSAAVLSLGTALATDPDRSRRLLEIDDDEARRAGAALVAVALVTSVGFLVQNLIYALGASVAATIALNCFTSLAYAVTAGLMILAVGRVGGAVRTDNADPARAPAWTLISLILAAAILVTVIAVLAGYSTLAALISGQIFWISLIAAVAYIVLRLIDDVSTGLFSRNSRTPHVLATVFRLKTSTVIQIGLLVSAGLQLLILLLALSLILTPFGQSGELLFAHIRQLAYGVHVGKATISPLGVAAGAATFAIGVGLAHAVRGWVVRRYLPVTDWDSGIRDSVSTAVGYLGVIIALACALAVTGLAFKQIALVASALSVGIGFGLQQVVQNFVAGVILLIERPVKVGDWINVGGVEGDVLKIRVRATEIRAVDCSTVIVPNSNLITLNLQNKTLGAQPSRIQLQVSVAKPEDAAKARDLILNLASSKPAILRAPAPVVYVDALAAAGGANLSCWFHLADPRGAQQTKSEMYFDILKVFQESGIAFL
jgi:small-conductance mechanosensitive channel